MNERRTRRCQHVTGWIQTQQDFDRLCPKTFRALVGICSRGKSQLFHYTGQNASKKFQKLKTADQKNSDEIKVNHRIERYMSTTSFMVFSIMYTSCKGPKLDVQQRCQSVTSADCQYDTICQHKSTFQVRKYLHYDNQCSTLEYLKIMVLCLSMQGEYVIKHTNGKCHIFAIQCARGKCYKIS